MARNVRITWRPVADYSPAVMQQGVVAVDGRRFDVSVRPGRGRRLSCFVNDDAVIASGGSMSECKAAVESLAHRQGVFTL